MIKWVRIRAVPSLVAGLFVFAVAGTVLLLRPVLSISPSDKTGVPALAAGITVSGVLVTAGVALVGYLLRQSIDVRNLRLSEEAAERALVDQQRLHMQTAIETVKLIGVSGDGPTLVAQASAAVLVLVRLDEIGLALDLAAEMWPKGQVTTTAAVTLCEAALSSPDISSQREAALMLFNNYAALSPVPGQVHWPSVVMSWPANLDGRVKETLVRTLRAWVTRFAPTGPDDFRVALLAEA